mmetsp:Transcript_64524/g.172851  ORF Transcript_64524/g.172851 Transcript_64524/m.172851 type:complete len:92 (+) Transcript_64524:3578-3853(+)
MPRNCSNVDEVSRASVLVFNLQQSGWTPLIAASISGHADVLSRLLGARADVEAKANDGSTALHAAAFGGHAEVVSQLVRAGANVNVAQNVS